jgi:hypothetical protein
VEIIDIIDDHSRLIVAAVVVPVTTALRAWHTVQIAAARFGWPAQLLSDNGPAFTAETFTTAAADIGIRTSRSRPYHPQTCGKIERFHQTLKRWLAEQPRARSIPQLQAQLDWFLDFYNQRRPHRALHGATPVERWTASPRATPAEPIPEPPVAEFRLVSIGGAIGWHQYRIGVGAQHAGQQILVIARGDDLTLFDANGLLRRLHINPTREYQPTGRPPGRPKRSPTPST